MDGAPPISASEEAEDDLPVAIVELPCPLCAMPVEVPATGEQVEVTCSSCCLQSNFMAPLPASERDDLVQLHVPPPKPDEPPRPADHMSRWLAGEPIDYFPGNAYRQFGRICKENKSAARAVIAVGLLLIITFVGLGWGYVSTQMRLRQVETTSQREILARQQRLQEVQSQLQLELLRKQQLEQLRLQAEREAVFNKSKYLTNQANSLLKSDPRMSARYAVDAARATLCKNYPLLPETHQSLRNLLAGMDGFVLHGHDHEIESVAISPEGRYLASGDDSGQILLWDLHQGSDGSEFSVLAGHTKAISELKFSRNGRWLISGSHDTTVRLWEMLSATPTEKPWVLQAGSDPVFTVDISGDGRWLVAAGGSELLEMGTARLWELSGGLSHAQPTELNRKTGPIRTLAFSPNSRWLALGVDEAARLWDLSARQPTVASLVLQGHAGAISSATFTEDNRWLVTCGRDETSSENIARLWDLSVHPRAESFALTGHKGSIRHVVASMDSRWLVTSDDQSTLKLWDLTSAQPQTTTRTIRHGLAEVAEVAFSRDNRWLAVGGVDGTVNLWSITSVGLVEEPVALETGNEQLHAMVFSPDSQWLATAGSDKVVRMWSMNINHLLSQAAGVANGTPVWPKKLTTLTQKSVNRFLERVSAIAIALQEDPPRRSAPTAAANSSSNNALRVIWKPQQPEGVRTAERVSDPSLQLK